MSKQHKRLALQDHAYDASSFCIHCGSHAEVIADEVRFCLTAKQREKVVAISHLRVWQIKNEVARAAAVENPEPVSMDFLSRRLGSVADHLKDMDYP